MNDLAAIPSSWKVLPLKRISEIINSGCYGEDKPADNRKEALRVITTAHIDPLLGFKLESSETRFFTEQEKQKYLGQPGDIFVVKSSGSNENVITGKRAQVQDEPDLVFSNFLLRVRPHASTDARFLFYLLGSSLVHQRIKREVATTTYPNLKMEKYLGEPLPFPPFLEQTAIARFLDRETGLIDGLIEKKTRFIALLKEKRAAVITHSVTKGIDPDAPMKDSGVDWLGRVPAHWDVPRIAALFREVTRPADPALPVLSVSIHDGVTDGELADEDRDRKVTLSEDRTKYQGVAPGDLVYNMMRAWQGAFGAVTVKGLVSPAYVVAAPVTTFRTKFIEHLLHTKSAAEEIRRFSRGIADFRMRLYWDHFRALKVCLPPLEEQDRILSEIDTETARIDGLISLTERSIDLLREKRAALITAAVTGKIDVRAAA